MCVFCPTARVTNPALFFLRSDAGQFFLCLFSILSTLRRNCYNFLTAKTVFA